MRDNFSTVLGTHIVPGIDTIKKKHPTRYATFEALVTCEILFRFFDGPVPTRPVILQKMIDNGVYISENSSSVVTVHLTNLEEDGLVYRPTPRLLGTGKQSHKKPIGARTYSIRSKLVCDLTEKAAKYLKKSHNT